MSNSSEKLVITALISSVLSITGLLTIQYINKEKKKKLENVYETARSLNEYLLFHYGNASELLQWSFGPTNSVHFPANLAIEAASCVKNNAKTYNTSFNRVLDIGCAVGRTSFELSHFFGEVVGIDYSHNFVATCKSLLSGASLPYLRYEEGEITTTLHAKANPNPKAKITFQQGDACNLDPSLGKFDCVVAANLIDRLYNPKLFLNNLKNLVVPGGLLLLTSPFTWMEQFTPKENWLGGATNDSTKRTIDGLNSILEKDFILVEAKDLPFFIREHARKNQWSVAYASFWIRKLD